MLDMRSKPSEKQKYEHKKLQLSNSTKETILTVIVIRSDKSRVTGSIQPRDDNTALAKNVICCKITSGFKETTDVWNRERANPP